MGICEICTLQKFVCMQCVNICTMLCMLLKSSIAAIAHCRPTAACSSTMIKVWANCRVCVKWIRTNSILSTHHIWKCNDALTEKNGIPKQLHTCHRTSYTKSCS